MKREYWKYLAVVFPYVGRHRALAVWSFVVMLVSAGVALLEPWPLAFLVNGLTKSGSIPGFAQAVFGRGTGSVIVFAVIAGFGITLGGQLFGLAGEYVNTSLDQRVSLDFRSDLFNHCQRLSQEFHDHASTGTFMYRINVEAKSSGELAVALPPLLQSILTLIGMFAVAMSISPHLALISIVVVPFIYCSIEYYGKRIEPQLIRTRGLEALSLTMVNDAMAMLRVITAFNRQDYEHGLFRQQGEQAVGARVRVTMAQTLFSLAVAVASAGGTGLVLFFGAHEVVNHSLKIGELLVLMSYIGSIYQPLQTISSTMAQFQTQLISVRFARELLDKKPDVLDYPGAGTIRRARGAVRFEGVQFSYSGRSGTLKDVSFDVPAGQVVAVVGPTGAGKSTLVSLIPRFLEPSAGRVLIDGINVHDITLQSLRAQISFVQQEPLLFSRSIAENIRYGRLDASESEIVAAAQAANAHDFVTNLPNQYETVLGERGARISGGERQRIAIARAFLKDAPILILDEPTSSIDSKTEEVILDALDRLMAGRTTFIVAHRLSTIRSADRILVMSEGRIVEQGRHHQLVRLGGLYSLLHSIQTRSPGTPGRVVDVGTNGLAGGPSPYPCPAFVPSRAPRRGAAHSDATGETGAGDLDAAHSHDGRGIAVAEAVLGGRG